MCWTCSIKAPLSIHFNMFGMSTCFAKSFLTDDVAWNIKLNHKYEEKTKKKTHTKNEQTPPPPPPKKKKKCKTSKIRKQKQTTVKTQPPQEQMLIWLTHGPKEMSSTPSSRNPWNNLSNSPHTKKKCDTVFSKLLYNLVTYPHVSFCIRASSQYGSRERHRIRPWFTHNVHLETGRHQQVCFCFWVFQSPCWKEQEKKLSYDTFLL